MSIVGTGNGLTTGNDMGALLSGIQADQVELNVIGNNIANATTPGYTNEVVNLSPLQPVAEGYGYLGQGVAVDGVTRTRNALLDQQYWSSASTSSYWDQTQSVLSSLQSFFGSVSNNTIMQSIQGFFSGWQNVASNPESIAARQALIGDGQALAQAFQGGMTQLQSTAASLNNGVVSDVQQINQYAQQIASLNQQIVASGDQANTLKDQRDTLVNELAAIVPVSVSTAANGAMNIQVDGHSLVYGVGTSLLATRISGGVNQVYWQVDGATASFSGGQLQAMIDMRDTTIPSYETQLNTLAADLISQVNTQHQAGYGLNNATGLNFFNGSGAGDISVNPTIVANPSDIAASSASGQPGNNTNALAIFNIENSSTFSGQTPSQFLTNLLVTMGADAQNAQQNQTTYDAVTQQAHTARSNADGVNINAEMALLVEVQNSYQAASKAMAVVQAAMTNLINSVQP